MATAGVFQIITNDGKQDRMLMATELLRNRLDAIFAKRSANNNIADPTPTLLDIEKTHILFTNAHFKPFAAIGFEYQKTNTNGTISMGTQVTFSIPQFGDFFYDMVLYVKLKQPTLTVDDGTDDSDSPLMRWCPYPGERLLKQITFDVNGNPLDSYKDFQVNLKREIDVTSDKQVGWDRCMGQEEPEVGYIDQPNWEDSGVAPSSINHRVGFTSYSGDQTPTGQKDTSVYKELLIPLQFWFNTDVRLAVPSVAIPYGQRFMKFDLCDGSELVNLVPRGSGGWTDATINGSLNYDNMVRSMELYINNIFVNSEIHNIFIRRIGFSLIRVHRDQTMTVTNSNAEILLQQLKWPIEDLRVGIKLKAYNSNTTSTRRQNLDKWHKFTKVTDTERSLQGWRSSKLSVKDASYDLSESYFNNGSGAAADQLTLTSDTAPAAVANNGDIEFAGIAAGDIIEVTLNSGNTGEVTNGTSAAVSESVTLTLEVAGVFGGLFSDDGTDEETVNSYIMFKQLVSDVTALDGIGETDDIGITSTPSATVYRSDSAEATATVPVVSENIDNISIKAHGIPIYSTTLSHFFTDYLPLRYGGPNVSVPKDRGVHFIPFNLYPGSYQPSGHINISRAREFYFEYNSSVISSSEEGTLYVSAKALNFLLITDGSAVLRYST